MGHFGLFSLFLSFLNSLNCWEKKKCRWLDLNWLSLVLEVTSTATAPQPLPLVTWVFIWSNFGHPSESHAWNKTQILLPENVHQRKTIRRVLCEAEMLRFVLLKRGGIDFLIDPSYIKQFSSTPAYWKMKLHWLTAWNPNRLKAINTHSTLIWNVAGVLIPNWS